MENLIVIVRAGIYLLMAISLIAAIAAVSFKNIFHAALALILTLLGVAGIYLALKAEFLAVVQILLYVGAVMTLVIFAIMLTHRISDKAFSQQNSLQPIAITGTVAFAFILGRLFYRTAWPIHENVPGQIVTTADLGAALLGRYVFPFEVISILLIAALIGAIVVAKREMAE